MNIKINRLEFLKKLNMVEKAIANTKTDAIRSGVYLETKENNTIILKGTDLDLSIIAEVEAEVIEQGKIVFSYQMIHEYLNELQKKMITLKVQDSLLIIETEESASEFVINNANEYPMIDENSGENTLTFSRKSILELFEKTSFAASQNTETLAVNCVRFEVSNEKIESISTDGYRLVYLSSEAVISKDTKESISIPLKSIEALMKILSKLTDEEIMFSIRNEKVYIKSGNVLLITKTINLLFPDYDTILNSGNYDKEIRLDIDVFIKVLKRVLIFAKNSTESKNGGIFKLEEDKLTISGESELANINETMEIDYKGEELKISLNIQFLLDFIQKLDKTDKLVIKLFSSESSVYLKNESNDKYLYITMPLAMRD